jgi:hypothetical protein
VPCALWGMPVYVGLTTDLRRRFGVGRSGEGRAIRALFEIWFGKVVRQETLLGVLRRPSRQGPSPSKRHDPCLSLEIYACSPPCGPCFAKRRCARSLHLGRARSLAGGALASHRGHFRHVRRRHACSGSRYALDARPRSLGRPSLTPDGARVAGFCPSISWARRLMVVAASVNMKPCSSSPLCPNSWRPQGPPVT